MNLNGKKIALALLISTTVSGVRASGEWDVPLNRILVVPDLIWKSRMEEWHKKCGENMAQERLSAVSTMILALRESSRQDRELARKTPDPNLRELASKRAEENERRMMEYWKTFKENGGKGSSPYDMEPVPSPCGPPPSRTGWQKALGN